MGFEFLGYGGHPSAEQCPKNGKPSLKARLIQLFKPKCFWLDETDCSEERIHSEERKKDPREEQHLNLRQWLARISEKDRPARFPTVVAGDDGGFSPENRDDYVEKRKRVQFRFPIDSIIIYSPDLDLDGDNFKC